jgi:hypothetical protein
MMTVITLMQTLVALGSLAALIVILYGPWQAICTDIARQILFEKRDAIFDLARSGKLSFNSPEYATIRSSLQASIRFAHELTLPRFLMMTAVFWARGSHPEDNDLRRAIRDIRDITTRNQVERLIGQAYHALVLMMLVKSPVIMVLLLPWVPVLFVTGMVRRLRRKGVNAVKAIERRAGGFIQLEADAA